MKIYLTFFSLLLLFIFNHAAGQSPQQFNYQAVARDASGDPLASKTLEMTTGIIQGSEDGSAVWSETQSVTTNEFGLFTLQIGKEEPLSVDWTDGPYYLNVQMNSGSGYIDMGTVPLLSVPYAIYGEDADADPANEIQDISLNGNELLLSQGSTVALPFYDSLWLSAGDHIYYTNGNVGVGTNTPTTALEVDGDIKLENDISVWWDTLALCIRQDGSNSYISNQVDFVNNGAGTNGKLILNGQNGISFRYGDDGPTGKKGFSLDENGNINMQGAIHHASSAILYRNTAPEGIPTDDGYRIRYDNELFGTNGDGLVFEKTDGNAANPDGGMAFVNTGNDGIVEPALTIRGNGRIGIGILDPAAKMELRSGILRLSRGTDQFMEIYDKDGAGAHIRATSDITNKKPVVISNLFEGTGTPSGETRIHFRVGDASDPVMAMSVREDGDVVAEKKLGIGVQPAASLAVGGSGSSYDAIYAETSNDHGTAFTGINRSTSARCAAEFLKYGSGYGVVGTALSETGNASGVHGWSKSETGSGVFGYASSDSGTDHKGVYGKADGGIGVYGKGRYGVIGEGYSYGYDFYANGYGTNYGSSSSIRWKRNIREIEDAIRMIQQLRGVSFDWDAEHGGHHDIGMIAEEVGNVLPEIVVYEENGVDATGMDYSMLTPLLVQGIKEQQEKIDQLEQENERMRAEIEEIRTLIGASGGK